MKKSSLVLSLLMLGISVAQASQLYTITLTSAERFTDCSVVYKSSASTKFNGKDKNGKQVTKEVPTSDIVSMREIVPAEAAKNEPGANQDEPAKEQTGTETSAAGNTQAAAAEGNQPAAIADGNVSRREGEDKAKDATLRLREMIATMDSQMAKISKPSRSLSSQVTQAKRRVTAQLEDMDKRALEVARLQDEFNKAGAADFSFDKVSTDQRTQYVRDGKAAYRAMKLDMKEKKGRRKVAGLDKFEIMRERYQGIPEYKEAYEWYIKTLHALQKKWTNMQKREEAARRRLQAEKRNLRARQDDAEYKELADALKEDGDDIGKVWFVPQSRNLKMLSISINKVKDAIRRNGDRPLDKEVGTVPALLEDYWKNLDEVRMAMVTGNLEGAEEILKKNPSYDTIVRLKTYLLPNEYRNPLIEQHREIEKAIRARSRDYINLKRQLERTTASLDRVTNAAMAQLESAMSAVQRELDTDAGDTTMVVEQEKPAQQPAAEQKPAEQPAAEQKPAEQPAAAQQ